MSKLYDITLSIIYYIYIYIYIYGNVYEVGGALAILVEVVLVVVSFSAILNAVPDVKLKR